MKYSSKEFGKPPEVDWTPMIDVTFQLISFFMFTLSFSDAEVQARVRLPGSELAKPPEAPLEKPLTLQLAVQRVKVGDREVVLDRPAVVLYAGEEVPIAGMRKKLQQEKEVMVRLDHKPAEATIIIRADGEAKTGEVQELIKICQETGFEKFVLRAENRQSKKK